LIGNNCQFFDRLYAIFPDYL